MFRSLIDALMGRIPFGARRSPRWWKIRKTHILRYSRCAACNTNKKLEVHHIVPFWKAPEREEDPENLITLCRWHHLLFGHFMYYKSYNEDVVEDAKVRNNKLVNRP